MLKRLLTSLSLWLLVVLAVAPLQAEKASSVDHFAGLDSIRLSTAVGGPLNVEGSSTPRLFAGDLRRFNRFREDLTQALTFKLSSCGLFVDDGAADEISVEVFGRPEELQSCSPRVLYLIQVRVVSSKLKASHKEIEPHSLSPVIGLTDEAGLERSLIEAAVATVAGMLKGCRG